ncbi:MAG: 5-formyltetrahydrofolate cyclo-ligase [Spirochaetaceae bacterium]|jgi:5-formyltetrahydrofolate cyclo-ligase|nr:5-formyltetrahydrofolate cyclo-ligase [Spirochaetaceae bacterium]
MNAKQTLRKTIKSRLGTLPPEQFCREGKAAVAHIRGHPLWRRYKTALLFLSSPTEIDTGPLLEAALRDTKAVFVPKTAGEEIAFYRILSPDGPWEYGAFHIREPAAGRTPKFSPEDFPALIIVPGLAFDRGGNRLGHGKGYYDRFFASLDREADRYPGTGPAYFTIGLCLEIQVVSRVPVEGGDKKMDALCTGAELWTVETKDPRGALGRGGS